MSKTRYLIHTEEQLDQDQVENFLFDRGVNYRWADIAFPIVAAYRNEELVGFIARNGRFKDTFVVEPMAATSGHVAIGLVSIMERQASALGIPSLNFRVKPWRTRWLASIGKLSDVYVPMGEDDMGSLWFRRTLNAGLH